MELDEKLGNGNIIHTVIGLAIPSMAAQFVNVLYSIADRIFVSHMPVTGETALAAIGICAPIVTFIASFAQLIGTGGSPLVGIKLGQGRKRDAEIIVANAFMLLVAISIIITVLAFIFQNQILHAFGASDTIYPYAEKYFKIYVLGTIFSLIGSGMNQFILVQGFSKTGMLAVIIGAVVNIVLDPVFIYLFNWGITGAAIATVLGQLCTCIFVLRFLLSGKSPVGLTFGARHKKTCFAILKTGVVPFFTVAVDNVLLIEVNMMLQNYGGANADLLVGCMAIVQSFMLIITMPLSGITGGTQAVLSYSYGAKKPRRVLQALNCIITICFIYCLIAFVISHMAPEIIVRIFSSDPEYISEAVKAVRIYTIGILAFTMQWPIVDGLIGMGQVYRALPLSFIRKAIYFFAVLIIPRVTAIDSIFYAAPLSDIIGASITTIVFVLAIKEILYGKKSVVEEG